MYLFLGGARRHWNFAWGLCVCGVCRNVRKNVVSTNNYAHNKPQDRHEIRELQGGDVFCGVFDGHGGWQVREQPPAR